MRHYAGGIQDWRDAGLPVEAGSVTAVIPPPVTIPRPAEPQAISTPSRRPPLNLAITSWSVARLVLTWALMTLGFGVLHWLGGFVPGNGLRHGTEAVGVGLDGLVESMYFSFVTALSIGYGDLVPVGLVRVLAVLEGAAGLLLFGMVISRLVSRRQDELTEEIHRIAFEGRLGRVRTDLHLVVSEMQRIAVQCAEGTTPPAHLAARFESAISILAGELRIVHDVLYRPRGEPGENVLEGILSAVAGALHEVGELRKCLPREASSGPLVSANLRDIALRAREICGNCVPFEHAPAIRERMDAVQRLAGGLG